MVAGGTGTVYIEAHRIPQTEESRNWPALSVSATFAKSRVRVSRVLSLSPLSDIDVDNVGIRSGEDARSELRGLGD